MHIKGGKKHDPKHSEDPLKEISVMQHISSQHHSHPGHKHIVNLRDALWNDHLVFEIMNYYNGGDLLGKLSPSGFEENMVKSLFTQLLLGLDLIHKCSVANLDISLENILKEFETNVHIKEEPDKFSNRLKLIPSFNLKPIIAISAACCSWDNSDRKDSPEP